MTENLLLTGSSGFIGSHLAEELMKDSRYAVRGFVGDITSKADVVRNLRDIDTVLNLAALTYLPPSWDSSGAYMLVNYGGVLNFLENHEMFSRFVQISTSHVYGQQPRLPIQIENRPLPDDPYCIAKFAAEEAVRVYSSRYRFKALVVRPYNSFGPRQSHHFVVPTFCLQALRDKKIVVRGNTKRELIYVKDTARALKGLLDKKAEGLVQIARGESYTMQHVASTIAALAGFGRDGVELAEPYRAVDIAELRGSPSSLLERLPGWKFTSLEDGLSATLDFYKQQA